MRPPRSHSPRLRPASWQRRRRHHQEAPSSSNNPGIQSFGRRTRRIAWSSGSRAASRRQACNKRPAGPGPQPHGEDTRHRAGGGRSQRRLVLGTPGVARERSPVGERQALTPENADRVIVAGERVARGERGAGEKAGFFGVFRHAACPCAARERRDRRRRGHGDSRAGSGRARRFGPVKRRKSAVGVGE